jgi:NADH-quinone oxidoreductase subunit C
MIDPAPVLREFPQAKWDDITKTLLVCADDATRVALFLRDNPAYGLDYCSNVSGVDYLPAEKKEKIRQPDGTEVETTTKTEGRIDVVYHLYSMAQKSGPLVLKQLTGPRENPIAASLTAVWRSCELQEREVYDLYGVRFTGHPDLRRILMWDEFKDFPMRKDYCEPDDYEYEPTPHNEVLQKTKAHYSS